MADEKITAMPALTTPADADVMPIVQIAGGPTNKKITWANIVAAMPTPPTILQQWGTANDNGSANWTNDAAGTGAFIGRRNGTADLLCGITVGTGTQSGGRVTTFGSLASVLFGGVKCPFSTKIEILNLSDGTDDYVALAGFTDKANNPTHDNGVMIKYDIAVSPNWIMVTAAGGVRTTVVSTIPVVVGITKTRFEVNAAGTSVTFYINDVAAGTSTTNIPVTAGQYCGALVGIYKTAGTNDRRISFAPVMAL